MVVVMTLVMVVVGPWPEDGGASPRCEKKSARLDQRSEKKELMPAGAGAGAMM